MVAVTIFPALFAHSSPNPRWTGGIFAHFALYRKQRHGTIKFDKELNKLKKSNGTQDPPPLMAQVLKKIPLFGALPLPLYYKDEICKKYLLCLLS